MKFCFSTLGCPMWSWEDILATAKDFGYDGIEVRGVESEMYVPFAKHFRIENMENTKKTLAQIGIQISCFTSGAKLFEEGDAVREAKDYIDCAAAFGVPYVRVLGDEAPAPGEVNMQLLKANLANVAAYAAEKGVSVLVETNGVFAQTAKLAALVREAGPGAGILWDVHHPFRYFGESVETTYGNIKPYLRHVHVKDSLMENGKLVYKMTGEGDIPVKAALTLLGREGFDGYISLEWVKRWNMELEDPGIVFMHFINTVKRYTEK